MLLRDEPPLTDFMAQASRFLFFTGKGGVGKTSLACAVSVGLADGNRRVLLISTDPASNLDEMLETSLSSTATPVAGVRGLDALNIDPHEAARRYRERIVGPYRGVLPEAAVANIEEQLSGACTTEIASFNAFAEFLDIEQVELAAYEHIVLDTAPTGHTLRLMNLPAAWSAFIAENKTGASCLGPLAGLRDQRALYERALSTMRDPKQTALVLVARPDAPSLREAARASGELRSLGLTHQWLLVNAVFEGDGANDPLARSLAAEASAALERLPTELQALPQRRIRLRPGGATGLARLRGLLGSEVGEDAAAAELGVALDSLPGHVTFEGLIDAMSSAGRGVILTMGKGGVGKTTLAIDVARALAERGHRVVLSTTDPADHITWAMEAVPEGVSIEPIDPPSVTRRHVAGVLETVGNGLDPEARALLEEELRSPCIEEIAVFTAFAEVVARGAEQFVVLDTAPTGHTLLLLDTTESYHREVARNSSTLPETVRSLLPRLRDPAFTRVLIVTLPEATPVHEAALLQEDLRRAGIEPFAWVVNRCLSGTETNHPVLGAKRAAEGPWLREVSERLARVHAVIPYRPSAVMEAAG